MTVDRKMNRPNDADKGSDQPVDSEGRADKSRDAAAEVAKKIGVQKRQGKIGVAKPQK